MSTRRQSRRHFLKDTTAAASAALAPYFISARSVGDDAKAESKNDRPILGCIGTGSRWGAVGPNAMQFSDCVAVCDVDRSHAEKGVVTVKQRQGREPEIHEDYRQLLDRKDIDVVTIVTPDHWHAKIAIAAMQAGKDVYCEKPLTLTIDEGKQICRVAQETGCVFQVGTQQRSEMKLLFLKAIALLRDGRIGDVKRIDVAIGGSPTSGPLPKVDAPSHLNWEMWLGQAPLADYRFLQAEAEEGQNTPRPNTRCHYEFRWWYEYSGGKLTDWGAHHIDIAQWGIEQLGPGQGPLSIEPIAAVHPVPFENGHPTMSDRYNCASQFTIQAMFPNNIEMNIRDSCKDDPNLDFENGIMFTGTKGRFFVSRNRLSGKPVEDLTDRPLPEGLMKEIYNGKEPGGGNAHMRNFFDCIKTRELPISDLFTHHRAMTTCHLCNIAIRLNRPLTWDPQTEQIVGDDDANAWQRREQRAGYEIEV